MSIGDPNKSHLGWSGFFLKSCRSNRHFTSIILQEKLHWFASLYLAVCGARSMLSLPKVLVEHYRYVVNVVHRSTYIPTSVTRLRDLLDFGGNFLKPLATISLSKSLILLGNFCKGVKIYYFPSEIILGNFYWYLAIFLVTLVPT